MGLTHSDIGGYTGEPLVGLIRSKELLLRWTEYAAFTPVMRTHEGMCKFCFAPSPSKYTTCRTALFSALV